MTAPIDYNAVLADLMAKRGQIDAAIEVIRAMLGTAGGDGEATEPEGVTSSTPASLGPSTARTTAARAQPTTIESDTFFGLSTADAIRKYLGMMKRPQTAQTITNALMAGGQVNATDPKITYGNVYSALTRNKGIFVKTRTKEWGLAEWYGSNKPKGDAE